jgi:trehalose 6-phosphate synthase
VNPYDIERTAEAIRYALEMEPEERTARMQRLRRVVKEQNIYRWAATLIAELCDVRLDSPAAVEGVDRRVTPTSSSSSVRV